MSLRLLDVSPDGLSGTRHEAARRSRPQKLAAELQIDDVVGAQRFDEMSFNRDVSGPLVARDLHRLGTNPDHKTVFGADALRWHRAGETQRRRRRPARNSFVRPPSASSRPGRTFITGLPMN